MNNEIIIYQSEILTSQIEVRIEDDTVWLNRIQLADLFDRDIKTIGKHISNALKEELEGIQVVAKFATTASDGKTYQVEFYNLDMIMSLGYRVKSNRGVQFRIWANKILKNYLLKGYAIHHRMDVLEKKVGSLENKNNEFDLILKTNLSPNQGIFYDGQIFDAHSFVSRLIKSAKKSILLIDNFVDETVLIQLSKREKGVDVIIYTKDITKQLKLDLERFNSQYELVEIKQFSKSHDRFLIIDETEVYHIGASLKDLGKKWFAFSKLNIDPATLLGKLYE
ncbi:DNA-binding protein [Flavobacterium sp. RSP46]|uniref:RhuM family protein n=1 Tax=Flavobacterium sp. RSP46 TaxID=2497486 RepID=UPI000F86D2AF|nr:DNA-binding protein [Flavobacterium sp. RSP46]